MWPEEFFGFERVSVKPAAPGNEPIWEEYGFEEGEVAVYARKNLQFTATAYRFADPTSAMAVYQWKHPVSGTPSDITDMAVETGNGLYLAFGNYVFRFEGYKPTEEQITGLLLVTPELDQSPLPTFPAFLPEEGLIPGSKRYVIGPASLREFEPAVPPSVAAFHFSVEAQFASYSSPKGDLKLEVFSYPTPQIARERLPAFRALPGAMVKRTGPLLAVVMHPPDADEAENLLSRVNFRATVVWDQMSARPELTIVEIVLTGFLFIGGLFLTAILLGVLFGGFRFLRWRRSPNEDDVMLRLHLDDR